MDLDQATAKDLLKTVIDGFEEETIGCCGGGNAVFVQGVHRLAAEGEFCRLISCRR